MPSSLLDLHGTSPSSNIDRPPFRWWSRVLIPAGIFLGVVALLLAAAWRQLVPSPTVQVMPAVAKTLADAPLTGSVVQAAGWFEAYPYLHFVTSRATGIIDEVLVLEGDAVTTGQAVARLDDADARLAVQRAQAELALRQAHVREASARLAAAERTWEHPIELDQKVETGKAVVTSHMASVAEAGARVAEQEARLAQHERNAVRASRLAADKVGSEREAEQTQAVVEAGRATLASLKEALLRAESEVARARAELKAATRERELRIADLRELAEARAAQEQAVAATDLAAVELAKAELLLARMVIYSPLNGVAVQRYKGPGDKVMLDGDAAMSATVLSLYDPGQLQARVDVPLADAGQIAVGQTCEIAADVLPGRSFTGTVVRVLHEADIQKNTLQAKVLLANPASALRPEMLCRVKFLAMAPPAGGEVVSPVSQVFVPESAVRGGELWLVREVEGTRGKAARLPVSSGMAQDGWLAVDGLPVGTLVITQAPVELREGMTVTISKGSAP